MRDFQLLKRLQDDFHDLDAPIPCDIRQPTPPQVESQMILRMLVRAKYGEMKIPWKLSWLNDVIHEVSEYDMGLTGIRDSWCYVTVRHGPVVTRTDSQWHFDGASFRTELIPERNYVWVNHTPPQFKTGKLLIFDSFDPLKHDLFRYAEERLVHNPIQEAEAKQWMMMTPFCFHRRNPQVPEGSRTFIRISFPDIEARDINNTHNPLLPTPAYGRDPVKSFRNRLSRYSVRDH